MNAHTKQQQVFETDFIGSQPLPLPMMRTFWY